jgi:hypothetical protein
MKNPSQPTTIRSSWISVSRLQLRSSLLGLGLAVAFGNAQAQTLVDFNSSAWNGGSGWTYGMGDVDYANHTTALPYVTQMGVFGDVTVTFAYDHSNGFTQGVVVNNYDLVPAGQPNQTRVSNTPELNAYGIANGGLIRIASDFSGDVFGNGDGVTAASFLFSEPVFINDFILGAIDGLGPAGLYVDNFVIRAYNEANSLIGPSSINLNYFGLTDGNAGSAILGDGGLHIFASGIDTNHTVSLDWGTEGVSRIDLEFFGTRFDTGEIAPEGGRSAGVAGFTVTPVPEPSAVLLIGIAGGLGLLRRRRLS